MNLSEAQARRGEEAEPDPEAYQDPDNETGLFAGTVYEQDDEEADEIYDRVDARLDERRKAKRYVTRSAPQCCQTDIFLNHCIFREEREAQELAEYRAERPKLQTQFADLKRGLGAVTDAEWENLPEVGNLTGKKRKRDPREGRAFAVPDSVLLGDRDRGQLVNSLDEQQQANGGFETPADGDGALTNLVAIGQARDNLLSLKLDQVSPLYTKSCEVAEPCLPRSQMLLPVALPQSTRKGILRVSVWSKLKLKLKLGMLVSSPSFTADLTRTTQRYQTCAYAFRISRQVQSQACSWVDCVCMR